MTQVFTPEELDFKQIFNQSAELPRDKFEVLKAMAIDGEQLAPHEKNFFCVGVLLSKWNDGSLYDYSCCDDFLFLAKLYGLF
jgi:hypothetical protein